MKAITELLGEEGLAYWTDRNRISVRLPDDSCLNVVVCGGNSTVHLKLPPSAIKILKQSFDMTPTLVGDYLVDVETLRKMLTLLLSDFKSAHWKKTRKDIEAFASEMRKMTTTEQKGESVMRVGQGKLRALLLAQHGSCQVSGIKEKDLLVASHIKPWAMCKDGPDERLDPENVLLLSANWDALFDRCYITFDSVTGGMKKAARIPEKELLSFGVPANWATSVRIPITTTRRSSYLKVHNALMEKRDAKWRCT